jgi:hypothetical protein
MPAAFKEMVGIDYYLRKLWEDRAEARKDAQLKLILLLGKAQGKMFLLELAARSGMEIKVFMAAIAKMQDADLLFLDGTTESPEEILVELTPAGRKLASIAAQTS